jgi:hypothetical protein
MKTVKTFGNLAEAGFASSLLESAGIKALLADEENFQWNPGLAMSGIRLQVAEEDFARAEKLLAEGPVALAETADEASAPSAEPESAPPPLPASESSTETIPVKVFVAAVVAFFVLLFATYQLRKSREAEWRTGTEIVEQDENEDGRTDRLITYRDGLVVDSQHDRNHDGKMDEWQIFDTAGRIESQRVDYNFDGVVDTWFDFAKGGPVRHRRDVDFNGIPDWFGTYENGLPVRDDCRPNDSKVIVLRYVFQHGSVSEEWRDEDRDGNFDYKILSDPFGVESERIPVRPGE